MNVEKNMVIERNGVAVYVHDIKNDQVYFQRWPKDVESQRQFDNLFRMPVAEFESQIR